VREQLAATVFTTTLVLQVVDGTNPVTNYLIKYNDLIKMFGGRQQDAFPCVTNKPMTLADVVIDRSLINIGKILKKDIYVRKEQFISCFRSQATIRAQRTYVLYKNNETELLPAVTPAVAALDIGKCKGPVTLWSLQNLPNSGLVAAAAPALAAEQIVFRGHKIGTRVEYYTNDGYSITGTVRDVLNAGDWYIIDDKKKVYDPAEFKHGIEPGVLYINDERNPNSKFELNVVKFDVTNSVNNDLPEIILSNDLQDMNGPNYHPPTIFEGSPEEEEGLPEEEVRRAPVESGGGGRRHNVTLRRKLYNRHNNTLRKKGMHLHAKKTRHHRLKEYKHMTQRNRG
jgi:hypothetical protein